MKDLVNCKYGMFIHHVLPWSSYADGSKPQTIDEFADAFDAEGFADSLERMGVEYIVFTAWHFAVQPLYPSAVSEKWRPGNCPKRDLLGDIIDSVRARDIHVVMYTHPRDGHDFSEEDKIKTGWGQGAHETDSQQPNLSNFDYDKWNEYMLELYEEFAERYASRLSGYYTDSNGPKDPADYLHTNTDHQIVNYLKIRSIMKSHNPDLVTFQNYYGNVYTNDYGNSETFMGFISQLFGYKDAHKWYCSKNIATTLAPFSSGWMSTPSRTGESILTSTVKDLVTYTMFNGSCSACGNVLYASGTFTEGNLWSIGVEETMAEIKATLANYKESFMDATPSTSYPTRSGSCLEDNNMMFFMTGEGKAYEYLHIMALPKDGIIELGLPEDEIELSCPICDTLNITDFTKTDTGYVIKVSQKSKCFDHVIRFDRIGTPQPPKYEWINNTDKRICYNGAWFYASCWGYDETNRAKGCYERELHCGCDKGDSLYLAFEGSAIEIYGATKSTYGHADIFIDGIPCAHVSQYGEEIKGHVLFYKSDNLYGGKHVLQMYAAEDKVICLDAVKVIY